MKMWTSLFFRPRSSMLKKKVLAPKITAPNGLSGYVPSLVRALSLELT